MKTRIHLNQAGYQTFRPKTAAVAGHARTFSIINKQTGNPVFSGALSGAVSDAASGENVRTADFSSFCQDGEYYITAGGAVSPCFIISRRPYGELRKSVQKAFYFSRCGAALNPEHAGIYCRAECHSHPAAVYARPSVQKNVSGGWHDGGDYRRCVTTGSTALAYLLYAYELFPEVFEESVLIPESGSGIPDILSECRWELQWLLKMQDKDGGVFHRLSAAVPSEPEMPADDTEQLYLFEKSDAATSDFCAVTALAARIFQEKDKAFSRILQSASLSAWAWLMNHPTPAMYEDPKGVRSTEYIEYPDDDFRDNIFWAAAELYSLTGEKIFSGPVANYYEIIDTAGFTWTSLGGFGALAYLSGTKLLNSEITSALENAFIYRAEQLLALSSSSGYRTARPSDGYIWGSNMNIAADVLVLAAADRIRPDRKWLRAAEEQVNYLLGKNPMGICYVTGFGASSPLYPRHLPSSADNIQNPIPGYLVGGPDSRRSDEHIRWHIPKGTPPAKCYLDSEYCFSTNDVSICANGALTFALSYLEHEYFHTEQED